ncbi:MAG TPA: hypothetical protein VHO67_10520 [Polyangia bacterium]|nr:hypothetical protein [Polyangia bacterium]
MNDVIRARCFVLRISCLAVVAAACGSSQSGSNIPISIGSGGSGSASGGAFGSGGAGSASGKGGGGGSGNAAGGAIPCDVAAVLASKCQTCHGKTTLFGAPMSLVTLADFQAAPPSGAAAHVYQQAATRIHETADPMPPKGQPALTSAETSTLDTWLAAGAPAGASCAGAGGSGGSGGKAGTGGAGGTVGIGPQALPCTPTYTFTAHAAGSTGRYPVPNPTTDQYVCFNFKSPVKPGEQAIAFAPIIDDARVIHHWILYGTNTAVTDGSVTANCSTASSTFVTGWAPGGQNAVMDPDIGLVLDYQYFQLQMHYNNQQYADGADSSGVAFCTTDTPRQHAAGIVTLGSPLINIPAGAKNYGVTGSCSLLAADGKSTITVVGTSPHMHLLGSGFKTTHTRGLMDMGDLVNLPAGTFSFNDQKHYQVNPRRDVLPGDVLTTTCTYDNPTTAAVTFGERTRDEMCFDFITVYPYGAATKSCFF